MFCFQIKKNRMVKLFFFLINNYNQIDTYYFYHTHLKNIYSLHMYTLHNKILHFSPNQEQYKTMQTLHHTFKIPHKIIIIQFCTEIYFNKFKLSNITLKLNNMYNQIV